MGRTWIYPKIIKGKLFRYRDILSYVFLLLLFSAPFIKINDEQLILLNVLQRKFVFFGVVFLPQDFYLFVLASLTFIVFIVLFTVVFGRVWCGWACPQTIFMEMVFRKIEKAIEGDSAQQKKLDAGPLTIEKLVKKTLKHTIFIVISFLISNIFLAYIISSDGLIKIITEPISDHVSGFVSIIIFTAVFYGVFAYLREIVCTTICPYGRLQGVLLDRQSIIVAYDYNRGEPRGHKSRNQQSNLGDCVDCDLCVQVCPTGIDIRQGTQLECINCTACIDACNMVMGKLNRQLDLIGFKTEEQIAEGKPFKLNRRVYAYAAVLTVMLSILTVLLLRRTDIDATIFRAQGTLYQEGENNTVSNLYNAELVNKTTGAISFDIIAQDPKVKIRLISRKDKLQKGETAKLTFFVIRPKNQIKKYKSEIDMNIVSKGRVVKQLETTFIAPPNL